MIKKTTAKQKRDDHLRGTLEQFARTHCDAIKQIEDDHRVALATQHLIFMQFIISTWIAVGGTIKDENLIGYFNAVATPVNNSLPESERADIPKWTEAIKALQRHDSVHEFFALIADATGVYFPDINERLARDVGAWAQ
jgi:hypothetical protein